VSSGSRITRLSLKVLLLSLPLHLSSGCNLLEAGLEQHIMISKVVIIVLTLIQLTCSIPSPNGLGSDLTILINNDILGGLQHSIYIEYNANRHSCPGPQSPSADSGVILLTPRSQISASAACAELGETLWSPESQNASIQLNLDYLTFSGTSLDQQYWIAPTAAVARTIDGKGRIAEAINSSARLRLPALCSQSAPFSDISSDDNSTKWQVTVHSNNEYLTGYDLPLPTLGLC